MLQLALEAPSTAGFGHVSSFSAAEARDFFAGAEHYFSTPCIVKII